ncbi:putative retinol dehydrogenase 13 [Mycobacterium avium subsp. avium 2285 (R)]|nr:putative retinol dehydrogenase 13 [Mycobacterium avium subsp. avium 2285 (R)]
MDAQAGHRGRFRIAVRHQPSGALRADRVAARSPAGSAGFAGGDGQQPRPPAARGHPLRRPALGAPLRPGRRLRPVQAGQPAVHLRAAAPAGGRPDAKTIAVAAHPGGSNTELARHLPGIFRPVQAVLGPVLFQSPAMGALPTLRAATDPAVQGAQYYGPDGFLEQRGRPKLVESSAQSHDEQLQRRLWAVSEELTGVHFPV